MSKWLSAAAHLAMCAAVCLFLLGGLALSSSTAFADDDVGIGPPPPGPGCPCSRCVNVCGGAAPCTGNCNNPDANCVAQQQTCKCNCIDGGGNEHNCACL
jgi:hypothetical protein